MESRSSLRLQTSGTPAIVAADRLRTRAALKRLLGAFRVRSHPGIIVSECSRPAGHASHFTVCTSTGDVLPPMLALPLYTAVMLWKPALRDAVL